MLRDLGKGHGTEPPARQWKRMKYFDSANCIEDKRVHRRGYVNRVAERRLLSFNKGSSTCSGAYTSSIYVLRGSAY
jgi:hypothetical protein